MQVRNGIIGIAGIFLFRMLIQLLLQHLLDLRLQEYLQCLEGVTHGSR